MTRSIAMPARCKTGIAASQQGTNTHLVSDLVAHFQGREPVQFSASFACGYIGRNVRLLTKEQADSIGIRCEICADVAAGPCVYRCYDADSRLIYIGSTRTFLIRMRGHKSHTGWWPQVKDVAVERIPTLLEARIAERRAIKAEQPPLNVANRGRRSA